jgi:outer membrane protein OmpA-like peptidoglycan-associated protein
MSAEKKVLLLLLSLIILIAVCVYTHLPSFMQDDNNSSVAKVEKSELNDEQNKSIVSQSEVKDNTQENNVTAIEDVSTNASENELIANNAMNEIQNPPAEVIEEVNLEDKVPEIPLITTDKRYIRTDNEKNIEELSKKTQELQIKMSEYVKENQVSFTRGSYKITKSSNKTIEMLVEALNEFKNLKIEVAGHTDAAGSAKLNKSISLKRAQAVKDILVSLGIDEDRMVVRGYGEDIPLVKNSPKGYSKINRRVEFNIVEE